VAATEATEGLAGPAVVTGSTPAGTTLDEEVDPAEGGRLWQQMCGSPGHTPTEEERQEADISTHQNQQLRR